MERAGRHTTIWLRRLVLLLLSLLLLGRRLLLGSEKPYIMANTRPSAPRPIIIGILHIPSGPSSGCCWLVEVSIPMHMGNSMVNSS